MTLSPDCFLQLSSGKRVPRLPDRQSVWGLLRNSFSGKEPRGAGREEQKVLRELMPLKTALGLAPRPGLGSSGHRPAWCPTATPARPKGASHVSYHLKGRRLMYSGPWLHTEQKNT